MKKMILLLSFLVLNFLSAQEVDSTINKWTPSL